MNYKVTFLTQTYLSIEAPSEQVALELFRAGHPASGDPLGITPAGDDAPDANLQASPPTLGREPARAALHLAVCQNRFELLDQLLDAHGLPIDTYFGSTPLHTATRRGYVACMEVLLKRKADPNLLDGQCMTCLMTAATRGDLEATAMLLEHGANPNIASPNGSTALMFAALKRAPKVMGLLIEHGADPEVSDERGWTPLHCVVGEVVGVPPADNSEQVSCTRLLIKPLARVDVPNHNGQTPLHFAALCGEQCAAVVDLLLEAGADPTRKDKSGYTPIERAIRGGFVDLALRMHARRETE